MPPTTGSKITVAQVCIVSWDLDRMQRVVYWSDIASGDYANCHMCVIRQKKMQISHGVCCHILSGQW